MALGFFPLLDCRKQLAFDRNATLNELAMTRYSPQFTYSYPDFGLDMQATGIAEEDAIFDRAWLKKRGFS